MLTYVPIPFAISQVPDISKYGVKITYPSDIEMVSVGELAIFGIAKYEATIRPAQFMLIGMTHNLCKRRRLLG
jgi:hypothetical protein